MNRITVLQEIINKIKARTYLEIGVSNGSCFHSIKAMKKIGVDPNFLFSTKKGFEYYLKNIRNRRLWNFSNKYYEMTSDDYFRMKSGSLKKVGFDVIFIDGLHTYEQSLKDVYNALKYLKKGGIVVMHDCSPSFEAAAYPAKSLEDAASLNIPGWTGEWNGDVWKTIVYLRSNHNDLNVFVLDCDFGLGIITRSNTENVLKYSKEEIQNLSYNDLKNNRSELLNLKSLEYFDEFLKMLN